MTHTSDFKPIDTAPKDGTEIILKTAKLKTRGKWGNHPTSDKPDCFVDCVHLDWGMSVTRLDPQPTEWKPILERELNL